MKLTPLFVSALLTLTAGCLTDDEPMLASEPQHAHLRGARWDGGVVYYQFAAGFDPGVRTEILNAASTWNAAGTVSFFEGTGAGSYVYIAPGESVLLPNQPYYAWQSYVYDGGPGGTVMGVGYDSTMHDYVHEWGHVLGLLHEHCHPSRAAYVSLHADVEYYCGQEQNAFGGYAGSTYDFDSVMHYDAFGRDYDGSLVYEPLMITPLDGRSVWSFGFTETPSARDLQAVRDLYPPVYTPPTCGYWYWYPYFCAYYDY